MNNDWEHFGEEIKQTIQDAIDTKDYSRLNQMVSDTVNHAMDCVSAGIKNGGWYRDHVSPNFVDYRNRLMAILNQESSLMEIVKLIGGDVLPDDQKLTLEIARVIRLGFLQQNAFHKDDTCVSMEKQFKMMEVILYLYQKSRELVARGMPMSVLKAEGIFEKVIAIKYDVPNDNLQLLDLYRKQIDDFYDAVLEKNA